MQLRGKSISPGFAKGNAYIIGPSRLAVPRYRITDEAIRDEHDRLASALRLGAEDLARLQQRVRAEVGSTEAEIFDAHLALLNDQQLLQRIGAHIECERINAEWAVEAAVRELAHTLATAENEYLRERARDIEDLGRRVQRHLSQRGQTPVARLPAQSILVARELYPLELVELDRSHLAGIVTEFGGETGHAAILARALGIPAISGISDATRRVAQRDALLLDGEQGIVWRDPPASEIARFVTSARDYATDLCAAVSAEALEARTRDGILIGLHANIGRAFEANDVGRHHLDGVGLFRTEYLFLDELEAPSFDKQRAAYQDAAERLGERPLVIRTLDLGGDKFPRFIASHREANPTLGLRGLRFSLTTGRPLFEIQVRAILAVAAEHRNVRILLPMVLGPADFTAASTIVQDLARRAKLHAMPMLGAMIETPAAVLTISEILAIADFASIGTNDLTQFMLATDRNALGMTDEEAVLHPAVLRAIKLVADAGAAAGKTVCVCGEAAADPAVATLLVGLGVRHLSMSPAASARVRRCIRALDGRDAEARAIQALAGSSFYRKESADPRGCA
jgi:phosphoenolpyruvate-protein phosphotransferase